MLMHRQSQGVLLFHTREQVQMINTTTSAHLLWLKQPEVALDVGKVRARQI